MIGFAVGWLAWRHFGEKGDKLATGSIPDGYAWAYKHETGHEPDDYDKDVEHGYGEEHLSSGKGLAYQVEHVNRRMPSTASTSGAQTWVGHPQPRKRSGLVGAARISPTSDQEHENTNGVRSPLLTQASLSEVTQDSKPLPASPLPPAFPYDDAEGDGVPYETIRHKSVRRRIWERLGFAEGDLGRKNSKLHEGEGRHTWSAGATQERGADVGRSLSFWGRRKTMKEGRIERWVRSVRGEGDIQPDLAHQEEVLVESMQCEETPPQLGTPELVLSTLRHVSPSAWHSQDSDWDPATAFGSDEKSPDPHPSTSHHLSPTLVAHSATTTRSGQRKNLRHEEQHSCGISLHDPGPVSGLDSVPQKSIIRTLSASRNPFSFRSTTTSGPKRSQSASSPTPPSPSSVSRYSATPHVPALSTLNRSPSRTPTRSKASRDLRTTLTRAAPSSRLTRPVSSTTPPAPGGSSSALPRTRPLPSRDLHTIRPAPQRLTSDLPAGPSSLMSPPLQSALCFDETLLPLTGAPGVAAPVSSMTGTKLPTPSRGHRHSTKRASVSGSTPPNARTTAIPPRSSSRSTKHTPEPHPAPRPFSPKERYLARQNANARVGMILTRSYSSRNFDERPVSPTMFGAAISEELESGRLEEERSEARDTLTFLAEGGEGIEQRLDRLRKH